MNALSLAGSEKMPGKPKDIEISETTTVGPPIAYFMHYRHGMNSKLEKHFLHNGDLLSARTRAEQHCKIMGYRLIWVRNFYANLEEEEAQQLGRVNG